MTVATNIDVETKRTVLVKLTALVEVRQAGWKALQVADGDVSLAVAREAMRDLPDGLVYVDRTAAIHGFGVE